MNLKHIEAFRAVMVSGSMTAAARTLFTSQPNVSRLISQLERETGLQLFQRSGVRLIPTSDGTAFFREVERAFVGLQGLANAAAQIRNLGSGRLRIAAIPSAGMTLVPHAIKRFVALFPEVTVSLHVNTSATGNCYLGMLVSKFRILVEKQPRHDEVTAHVFGIVFGKSTQTLTHFLVKLLVLDVLWNLRSINAWSF